MVVAHDRKALDRWRSQSPGGTARRGLTGAALEQAVMALALSRPEYVQLARAA